MFAGVVGGIILIIVLTIWCTSKMADNMETKVADENDENRSRSAEQGGERDASQRSASKDKKKVKRE